MIIPKDIRLSHPKKSPKLAIPVMVKIMPCLGSTVSVAHCPGVVGPVLFHVLRLVLLHYLVPTYLKENFVQLTDMQRALLGGVPLFMGGFGSIFAGLLSARLDAYLGSVSKTRRILGVAGMGIAGVMLIISMQIKKPMAFCARYWHGQYVQ